MELVNGGCEWVKRVLVLIAAEWIPSLPDVNRVRDASGPAGRVVNNSDHSLERMG